MDREAWWATVHRVTKNRTRLKQLSMHTLRAICQHMQRPVTIYNLMKIPWSNIEGISRKWENHIYTWAFLIFSKHFPTTQLFITFKTLSSNINTAYLVAIKNIFLRDVNDMKEKFLNLLSHPKAALY